MFQIGTRLCNMIMKKDKESIIITHKKYNEILKKYEDMKVSLAKEQKNNQLNAEEIIFLTDELRDLKNREENLLQSYDILIQQQLSVIFNVLTEDNVDYFYNMVSSIDYDGQYLWDTCYELLKTNPGDIFSAEENKGWFESMSFRDLVKWAEIANFYHISWKRSGMHELYDSSSFDDSKYKEYQEYKAQLHYGTMQKIITGFSEIHKRFLHQKHEGETKQVNDKEFYDNVSNICRKVLMTYTQINYQENVSANNNSDPNIDSYLEDDEEAEI